MPGQLAQVEDDVSRRERIARGVRGARDVALAAFGARVERDEVLPRKVGDLAVPDLLGRRLRREERQPLAGEVVPHADVRRPREHVHRLRERDRRDERERHDTVRPPGREVRTRSLLRGHPERAEAVADRPADRRPRFERRIRLRDAERFEEEAGQREEEENREEDPVADHVPAAVLVAVGPPVVEPAGPHDPALHGHYPEPDRECGAEHVEHERVAEVEPASPEVEAEERLRDVVLEPEDRRPYEKDEEAVEDQHVAEARERVASFDPAVREDNRGRLKRAPTDAADRLGRATAPVLEHEQRNPPEEDRRRDDDQHVPEDDLPVGEAREGLPRLGHTSFVSSSATSKRSATAPKCATSKIAASGSVLTAMIVSLVFMPAR